MPRHGQLKWSELKVGLVVTVALVMVVIAIMNMSHGLNFINRQPELRALVDHTQGLKVGGPVRMNGVDVGNVRSIGIAKDSNAVEIVFSVQRTVLPHLREDATVNVRPWASLVTSTWILPRFCQQGCLALQSGTPWSRRSRFHRPGVRRGKYPGPS